MKQKTPIAKNLCDSLLIFSYSCFFCLIHLCLDANHEVHPTHKSAVVRSDGLHENRGYPSVGTVHPLVVAREVEAKSSLGQPPLVNLTQPLRIKCHPIHRVKVAATLVRTCPPVPLARSNHCGNHRTSKRLCFTHKGNRHMKAYLSF